MLEYDYPEGWFPRGSDVNKREGRGRQRAKGKRLMKEKLFTYLD
jgi:hypothetical protein